MLYLIDSSIYIFRGWRTLPASIVNTHGEQANAVQGFTETLAQILSEKNPEYIVCAFDKSAKTGTRYTIFADYKANRTPPPQELSIQIDRCMQIASAFGVPVFSSTQVEADDIIGSFSHTAQSEQCPVTIVSADKDLVQFIGEDDTFWHFSKKQQWNYRQLSKRFKIRPDQLADMLALCGDKVDNIPGIPGVGPATAAKLLKKWESLDGVIDNHRAIKDMSFRGAPHVAQLIADHASTIQLSRQLTGLIVDSTLPNSLEQLKRVKLDYECIVERLILAGVDKQRAEHLAHRVTQRTALDALS